jgi:antitoxin CcdA
MRTTYPHSAPKRATNVTVNRDLLERARRLKINLSQALEDRLAELVREDLRRAWLAENGDAIEEYNRRAQSRGVFSDGLRRF